MRRLSKEEFIEKARSIHGDKYDYSKVEYINSRTNVCIICPEHGEFWQRPTSHLRGENCPKCAFRNRTDGQRDSTESFIKKSIKIHGDKYDYSKVIYFDSKTKVCIICPEHGEFWQSPNDHLNGCGCKKCANEKRNFINSLTCDEFIERAKLKHGNKYDYSKVNYINSHSKVCIICPEHGEFWQMPYSHINGNGCPMCKQSQLERDISLMLSESGIRYIYQYYNYEFLNKLSLDFYLPDYNIGIECQGIQHFEPIEFFGGEDALMANKERDERKRILCENNGITVIYYFDNEKYFGSYEKEVHNIVELKEFLK